MSAFLVWIGIPAILALILYLFRARQRAVQVAGLLASILLTALAWRVTVGETVSLGPLALTLGDTQTILGRRFVIGDSLRPALALIYGAAAIWFGGSMVAPTNRLFVPMSLGIASLLTAALAVEPFLYAALLIEVAALVSIPILSPPGQLAGRGVLRFLIFQTIGMAVILFTGWMFAGLEASPGNADLALRVSFFMALGIAFLVGIFPFHTWIPMLAEESNPYSAAFIFYLLPGVILIFCLGFLEQYEWMRSSPAIVLGLRFLGVLMIVTGGIGAAFQRHLGRIMGYATSIQIGLSLLSISLVFGTVPATGVDNTMLLGLFFALWLLRGSGLALWSLALTILQRQSGELRFRAVHGLARRLPVASIALLVAHFSLAGLPVLAGFPIHRAIWEALAPQSLAFASLGLLGNAGLMAGGIRTLVILVTGEGEEPWQMHEKWPERIFLVAGCLLILLLGLLPQLFMPSLIDLARLFRLGGT